MLLLIHPRRIGLDNGLALNRHQAIIWTNADPVHWCIYVALGGDELTGSMGTNFCEIFIQIKIFLSKLISKCCL